MVFAVLLIHAVLLPLLSYGMLTVVRNTQEQDFIDSVRIYTRMFADLMQSNGALSDDGRIIDALDSAMLSGRCVYAVFEYSEQRLLSSLMAPKDGDGFKEDFRFDDHGDGVYFLSVPLEVGGEMATLRLGFDENPTLLDIQNAWSTILLIVLVYLLVTVGLVLVLSNLLSRPLRRLRRDSRQIASGDYTRHLAAESEIFEISELSHDLEHMRSTLVGINARLEGEIASREAAEIERRKAEDHLRHMHRVQSIGTLAGGVAHEFNNVLLPILLYTDLALEDLPDDSPVRPNIERVVKLAHRAQGLSKQILAFGRPSGDALVVVPDIAPIVEEAMSMVRALIPATIEILLEIERHAGPVKCNSNEIQQLVVNLCSNAFQSLGGGGGRIRVGLAVCVVTPEIADEHPRPVEGRYVRLSVSDNGEGMDSATIDRIFDPFFTTRNVGKGTGLGLSVVHGIVTTHKGEIVVSSEVGTGSTVDVYFPQVDA